MKMTKAFEPGDPVLELAALGQGHPNTVLEEDEEPWLRKAEQLKIDAVRTFEKSDFPNLYHVPSRKLRSRLYTLVDHLTIAYFLEPLP